MLQDRAHLAAVQALPLLPGNPVVYLDVVDGDEPVGRIIIQLRADTVPRTAENFRALCEGSLGWGYKGSPLPTVEKGRRVFGGDFFGAGQSGFSIYGDTFEDESFALPHLGPGTVGMRNCGPDSNNSQFYICFSRLQELDGRSVVVGYVREGWEVLRAIDKAARTSGGRFYKRHEFRVAACGELKGYYAEQHGKAAARAAQ